MTDKLALSVLITAPATVVGASWLDTATGYAEFAVAIASFVGVLWAAAYHYERWRKLRNERKEKK